MKSILLFIYLIVVCQNNISETFEIYVSVESKNNYQIVGDDRTGNISGLDNEIKIKLGDVLKFSVETRNHPFLIKTKAGIGKKNMIDDLDNNGTTNGEIFWTPSKPGTYYYQCLKHKNMVGLIIVE